MRKDFEIKTLDAQNMIDLVDPKSIIQKEDNNYGIRLLYDLSKKNSSLVLHTDNQQSNAFFWQLASVVIASKSESERETLTEDLGLLSESLIYIDFKGVFNKDFFDENFFFNHCTLSKEELKSCSREARSYKLKLMFDQGIEISFDGNNFKRFIPYDKSSSMSRACVISFIDASLQKDMDERLMLGMDFASEGIKVNTAKYFAYRGLYMTESTRIEEQSLILNEETVIILDDDDLFRNESLKTDVFTAKEKAIDKKGTDILWECCTDTKKLEINSFDGEGIIAADYATKINDYLLDKKKNFSGGANSFQIRMPFTKGMLHAVSFLDLLSKELDLEIEEKNLFITDVFGWKRDLRKSKIILTKSMFKLTNWIRKYCEKTRHQADPMKFFFERFHRFQHALYVALTNVNLHNTGKVQLNYQFLSTLRLEPQEFSSLIDDHVQYIKDIPVYFSCRKV